jgi:hypothetical protein
MKWNLRYLVLVATTLALAACATQTSQDAPSTTSTTTAAPTTVAEARSDFPASGPVEAGTYRLPPSAWSVADVTMTMPGGWETDYGAPYAFKSSGPDGAVDFSFMIVDSIFADPCVGSVGEEGGESIDVGPSVDDLANALLNQPHTVATGPVDTTLGGLPAKRIDLTVEDGPDTETCNVDVPGNLQIWHSDRSDDWFVLFGDGAASVYIFEVNGERQVLRTQYAAGAKTEDINELQEIVESIRFDT